MEYVIKDGKITFTGVDGQLEGEQISELFRLMDQASSDYQHHLSLIRFRDTLIPAGMAYLDEHYPDHVQRVDIDRLDMQRADSCVLAQASGMSFWDALKLLTLDHYWRSYELGFEVYTGSCGVTFPEATQLWRDAYQARRDGQEAAS